MSLKLLRLHIDVNIHFDQTVMSKSFYVTHVPSVDLPDQRSPSRVQPCCLFVSRQQQLISEGLYGVYIWSYLPHV